MDFPEGLVLPFWLGNGAEHRREARLLGEGQKEYGYLLFAYTVQPGDMDIDGIYIGASPLGDNAGVDFHAEGDSTVPAYLSLAANQLAASQAVDGSASRRCQEVFCSTVTASEALSNIGAGLSLGLYGDVSFVRWGASSAWSFGYDTEDHVFEGVRTFCDSFGCFLILEFLAELPQSLIDKLALDVDGTVLPLSEADFADVVYFEWSDVSLRFAEGDEIDVKLIETATVTFDAATYTADEGGSFPVTVTLGEAFVETTVTLPVVVTGSGGVSAADYSGVPANLVFAPGETEKSFTVTLTDDDVDDDGEGLTLSYGTESNIKSGGTNETARVVINDDDDPEVTVQFSRATYRAIEGGTATVTVELSADPERTVAIPLTKTNEGGASLRLLGGAGHGDLQLGRHVQDLHVHGGPGHPR